MINRKRYARLKRKLPKSQKGLTLIELMIVVVIIGVLASLALPRFMRTTTKSKQSEAKGILKQIYTMEQTYRVENDVYFVTGSAASATNPFAFADLGLGVEIMTSAKYTYTLTSTDNGVNNFTCTATSSILDDDVFLDSWTIDQSGVLQAVSDDALN